MDKTNRAGRLKKCLSGEAAYSAFVPSPLPPSPPVELDDEGVSLLVAANKQVAILSSVAAHIPSVKLFVSMYVRKEALMSSQIEGTQATLEDVLDPLADQNANRDVAEAINHIKATNFALARMSEIPLCNRLLREAHEILMSDTRGQDMCPGEFRHSQNWIGGGGSTIKNARFIPPPPDDMLAAMDDLEKYINGNDNLDALIKVALIHYQFETIHPFLDGNGRLGRLLITLYLMKENILTAPALYISYFLKKYRVEYYDRLSEVRRTGNYEQWVKFFLRAICECAEDATDTIGKLTALHEKNLNVINNSGRTAKTDESLFFYIEENPIIEIGKTAAALNLTFNTISNSVKRLCELGILSQYSGEKQRNRTFAYTEYLDILRDGTEVIV